MWRFPRIARFFSTEGVRIAVETALSLEDGTYWEVPPERPWGGFPEQHDPDGGFGGGYGGEG